MSKDPEDMFLTSNNSIHYSKMKGAFLKFAREIDRSDFSRNDDNRTNLMETFDSYMFDKFGGPWSIFREKHFDDWALKDMIWDFRFENEEYDELLEEKYDRN